MNKINPIPDFLTHAVHDVFDRTKECMAKTKFLSPVLVYIKEGSEFSVPLHYDAFVEAGRWMRETKKAVLLTGKMGWEFAFMSMEFADRAEDPEKATSDRHGFQNEIEHMLFHLGPDHFFISTPIKYAEGIFTRQKAEEALRCGTLETAPTALLVLGQNRVRSYGLIVPFYSDPERNFYYDKPKVVDSFSDEARFMMDAFTHVYAIPQN